jgi:hypothetical protein
MVKAQCIPFLAVFRLQHKPLRRSRLWGFSSSHESCRSGILSSPVGVNLDQRETLKENGQYQVSGTSSIAAVRLGALSPCPKSGLAKCARFIPKTQASRDVLSSTESGVESGTLYLASRRKGIRFQKINKKPGSHLGAVIQKVRVIA